MVRRYTLSAMCGMHVHTTKPAKAEDVIDICGDKFKQLVIAFKTKYPNASVNQFLDWTTLTKLKKIEGKNVYAMSKQVRLCNMICKKKCLCTCFAYDLFFTVFVQVRKVCVNDYNRFWESCLGPGGNLPQDETGIG